MGQKADSAANQFGASVKRTTNRAANFRLVLSAAARELQGERSMSTFSASPSESNQHMISSILNLVCPQCGGRMSQFQCEGRCGRNWLAEWEWANRGTKSSKTRVQR